uniref:F-box associated beta-propeller type 1 domain-containing protein n=1 Tax=Chenopodium quinoa TaxID=63459 RepID=A0A803LE84_CHEQI
MISSREFAKQQFEFRSSLNDQTLIVQDQRNTLNEDKYYLSFDEKYNLTEFVGLREKYLPRNFNLLNTGVVDYCDVLLCMYNEQTMRIYVWNPVTNQCRDTNGPVALDKVDDYQMKYVGFDYVSLIGDYKIGCLMFYKNSLHALMFSFKTGLWTEWALLDEYYETMEKYYGDPSAFVDSSKVFVDDTIYWAPKCLFNEIDDEEIFLFGMDLIAGDMMFVPIVHREDWEIAKLFKMNGSLALCLIGNGGNKTNVFLMKLTSDDDKDAEEMVSWERVLSLTYIGAYFVYLFETGKCLVSNISLSLSSQSLRLMLHELSQVSSQEQEQPDEGTIVWESEERGSLCRYFSAVTSGYSESLFSPFDPYLLQENQDG